MPKIDLSKYAEAGISGNLIGASCSNADMVKICDVMIYAQEAVDGFPNDDAAISRLKLALKEAESIYFEPIVK